MFAGAVDWQEQVNDEAYNHKCDVWAVGCIVYEMAALRFAHIAHTLHTLHVAHTLAAAAVVVVVVVWLCGCVVVWLRGCCCCCCLITHHPSTSLVPFLFPIVHSSPPFEAKTQLALAVKIRQGVFQRIPARYSDDLQRIIELMLTTQASHRPGIAELIQNRHVALRLREIKVQSQ